MLSYMMTSLCHSLQCYYSQVNQEPPTLSQVCSPRIYFQRQSLAWLLPSLLICEASLMFPTIYYLAYFLEHKGLNDRTQ